MIAQHTLEELDDEELEGVLDEATVEELLIEEDEDCRCTNESLRGI